KRIAGRSWISSRERGDIPRRTPENFVRQAGTAHRLLRETADTTAGTAGGQICRRYVSATPWRSLGRCIRSRKNEHRTSERTPYRAADCGVLWIRRVHGHDIDRRPDL